jgi:Domain of unknown function (DUF4126)
VDLFLDITLGIGLALAAGLRPFLPALLAGALGSARLGVDFTHTSYSFLQSSGFLLAVTAGLVTLVVAELVVGAERLQSGPVAAALSGIALGIGALLFAGVLSQHGDAGWPGLPAGLVCAALAQTVSHGLLERTRGRLTDASARRALPVYAEAASVALAALVVLAPPLSLIVLVALARLALAARRRDGERYAGLRILR